MPSVTLFVFATLLADDRYRTVSAVLEVGAVLAVRARRTGSSSLERSEGWVDGGPGPGRLLAAARRDRCSASSRC